MRPVPPRVCRYQSGVLNRPAFGLVLRDRDGIPDLVYNLTQAEPAICQMFDSFNTWDDDGTHRGFALAARLWSRCKSEGGNITCDDIAMHHEMLAPEQVLPCVEITEDDVRAQRRFVISMGLNYESHRLETNRGADLVMVNATGTTAPYAPVTLLPEAELVDYEAELACVLLDDIDLDHVPDMPELEKRLAYFVVNDLTDRAPIIRDEVTGYTAGKSDPGFLPVGPWMVHGQALPVFTENLALEVTCCVTRTGEPMAQRQCDRTSGVLRNPSEILRLLAQKLASDPSMAHPDRHGARYPFAKRRGERPFLPAGSLILTGTPGGTCIRAPHGFYRLGLLLRGGFNMRRARETYVRDLSRRRRECGYLMPGDTVETSVEGLGRQCWTINAPAAAHRG